MDALLSFSDPPSASGVVSCEICVNLALRLEAAGASHDLPAAGGNHEGHEGKANSPFIPPQGWVHTRRVESHRLQDRFSGPQRASR